MKEVTAGLREDKEFPDISKGSKYRKQAFLYDAKIELDASTNPIPARIIVEISAFANPFPNEKRVIEPFVTTFLKRQGMDDFITQYHLEPFELNVLSLKQTLCEKQHESPDCFGRVLSVDCAGRLDKSLKLWIGVHVRPSGRGGHGLRYRPKYAISMIWMRYCRLGNFGAMFLTKRLQVMWKAL